MRQLVVDTNVFVSFFVERNETQRIQARRLFRSASQGDIAIVVPQLVLFEISYVLKNRYDRDEAEAALILDELVAMPGVVVVDNCPWTLIRKHWPSPQKKLPDAGILATAMANGLDGIATFEKKLARYAEKLGLESYW